MFEVSNAGIQADLSTLREVTAGGYPAVENEHDDRIQCVGKKLYIFTATWPTGSTKPPELSRIINSFRLLPK